MRYAAFKIDYATYLLTPVNERTSAIIEAFAESRLYRKEYSDNGRFNPTDSTVEISFVEAEMVKDFPEIATRLQEQLVIANQNYNAEYNERVKLQDELTKLKDSKEKE